MCGPRNEVEGEEQENVIKKAEDALPLGVTIHDPDKVSIPTEILSNPTISLNFSYSLTIPRVSIRQYSNSPFLTFSISSESRPAHIRKYPSIAIPPSLISIIVKQGKNNYFI